MRKILFRIALLLVIPGFGQNYTARLLDASNGEPVPFATIKTGTDRGTISNEEGYFTLDIGTLEAGGIEISCMGYRTTAVEAGKLSASLTEISLEPAAINLNEVQLSNRIPDADEIIANVRDRLKVNYGLVQPTYELFYRKSEYMQFDDLDLELEKASDLNRRELEAADKELQRLGDAIIASEAKDFLDFKGLLRIDSDTASTFRMQRATRLTDSKKNFSTDKIQERAQQIILSHLDSNQTYKVKTGIFKIEDSISLKEAFVESEPSDSTDLDNLKGQSLSLLKIASWKPESRLRKFLDGDMYNYSFKKATYFNGNYVYALGFVPRRSRAKFTGTLYVDAISFAILKADYEYAKGREGQKVNLKLLLGIKFIDNLHRGTVIFQKDIEGLYRPYFIQRQKGNYIYLHRSLKFIENSANRKKVRFDFLLEGGTRENELLLIRPASTDQSTELTAYKEPKKVPVIRLTRYEPTIWQDSEIIAPLQEMKNFRVSE
ncbi:carboxypeptidase-like regulatory domain-containing protein [Robiginitalea sp. IMCC44478]|uniref:carboxypeptidase-like regulatory domain-containing protein n=1 Tax=Robiginitalea sp. IMCC44478 TaxID=3459122 RepID=UPI004041B76A